MNILLLGGTTEASALARALATRPWRTTLSLAGRTRNPIAQPVPTRIGGFGGIDGLAAHLRTHAVDALLDATHPFAAQMTRHAAAAAALAGTPLLRLDRPAWTPPPGADWHPVHTMAEAAAVLGPTPRRVLLTVGQKELAAFGPPHAYVVRSVDPPPAPPPGAIVLTATGPFHEVEERDLLLHHRIDVLVTKNAGGAATAAKLAAAAALGLRIVVVARPALPPGIATVPTSDDALAWLEAQAATRRSE